MALTRSDLVASVSGAPPHGTGSFATAAFTPPNDSIMVIGVMMMGNNTSNDLGPPTISGGGWTYTQQANAALIAAYSTRLNLITAPVATGASMSVTVDDNDNQNIYGYGVVVIAFTGYDTGTPIAGIVTSGGTSIGDGAESQTLSATPTADDVSLFLLGLDADNQPANPTLAAGWTEIYDTGVASGGGNIVLNRRESSTSTTVSVTDVYTGGGTMYKSSMISLIVKAAAAAAAEMEILQAVYRGE